MPVGVGKPKPTGRLVDLLTRRPSPAQTVSEEGEGEKEPADLAVLDIYCTDPAEETPPPERVPIEQLTRDAIIRQERRGGLMVNVLAETGENLTEENWPLGPELGAQPLYPYGRHILRVGRDTLLVDEPREYDRWPLRAMTPLRHHRQMQLTEGRPGASLAACVSEM